MGRLILVGGGVRSGKSSFARRLALARPAPRVFVATAEAGDDEMRARIARHRAERGDAFETVEEPVELAAALGRAAGGGAGVVLIDCLTLWLSNLLGRGEGDEQVLARVDALVEAARACPAAVIAVTNEVGLGLVPASPLGRRFRDLAGWAHQRVGAAAEEVYWAALGTILRVRPSALEVEPGG